MKTLVVAAVLIAPAIASAADLSGAWKVSSSVGATPITVDCALLQKDKALGGACAPGTGPAGPAAFSDGVVDGNHASWGYDVTFNGAPAHVGFKAEITSDTTMTGTLELSGRPSPFTATKQ
jgi:hypothetical protein